jgi:RNA polymerase sigma factor (TIGR02999 family)
LATLGFELALINARTKSKRLHRSGEKVQKTPSSEQTTPPATDRGALDDLFSLVYEELWRHASSIRRRDPGATQHTGTLVHEAWLRLKDSPRLAGLPPSEFIAIAARVMRQILVDAARKRHALKRGGADEIVSTELSEFAARTYPRSAELLTLDRALTQLEQWNPRQATIVDCRFFLGMSVSEAATSLDLSESSVERDWRAAKAWLDATIRGEAKD